MRCLMYINISVCFLSLNSLADSNQALLREKRKECQMAVVEKTSFYRKKLGQLRAKQKTSGEKSLISNTEYSVLQGQKKEIQKSMDESGITDGKVDELKQINDQLKSLGAQQKASQETVGINNEIKIIKQAMADVRKEEMQNHPACVEGYEKKTRKSKK